MSVPWWRFNKPPSKSNPSTTDPTITYILDRFTQGEISHLRRGQESVIKFFWEFYNCLAMQRSRIMSDLKLALASNCEAFEFTHWVRLVDFRYATHPLSAVGSIKTTQGGRFNIGSIDETRFPRFASLYIAENFETAYREKFGVYSPIGGRQQGLAPHELALSSDASWSLVKLRGRVEQVLNINKASSLSKFVKQIRGFKIPGRVKSMAADIGLGTPAIVKDRKLLQSTLMEPLWRAYPMHVDIPSNPQIFGQIAHAAGIEAIRYTSVKSGSEECLAVFPDNFQNSSSFIELEGPIHDAVRCQRLDSSNWPSCVQMIN